MERKPQSQMAARSCQPLPIPSNKRGGGCSTYANGAGAPTNCYLDLISCEATMKTAVSSPQASNIPDDVVSLSLYNKVFEGKQFLAKDAMGATPSQRILYVFLQG